MSPLPGSRTVHPQRIERVSSVLDGARPERVEILKRTSGSDGAGGRDVTYTIDEVVNGRLVPITSVSRAEREIAEKLASQTGWFVVVPRATHITTRHRVRVVASDRTFEVSAIFGPHSYEPELRVLVTEVS